MKLVVAYIKPDLLDDVMYALHNVGGLRGASVADGRGFGAWRMDLTPEELDREPSNYRPHVRIEVVCSDDTAPAIAQTIADNARTGLPGDGVVYTTPVSECLSVRTGGPDERLA